MQINGLEYRVDVSGVGETLILLHGFTGSRENWQPFIDTLAEQYQVVTVDLPGHGETDGPNDPARYAMEPVAADIVALIERVSDEPAHLLGYSMGGRLALYVAVHHSQHLRSLTLESASPGLATATEQAERRDRDNALANRIEREGIVAFVDFWEQLSLWDSQQQLSADVRGRLREQRLRNNPVGLANSLRGMGTGVQPSLWGALEQMTLPTLLITGQHDAKFQRIKDEMAERLPNVERVVIPGAGHTTHLERPSAFLTAVREHLAERGGDRA